METGIRAECLKELAFGMQRAPALMLEYAKSAFHEMGRYDLKTFKERYLSGGAGLNARNKGFHKSWKHYVPDRATTLSELKLSIYTKAPIMAMHQHGGTIKPKDGRGLTILTDAARGKTGRRRLTQKELLEKMKKPSESGIGMIHTQKGVMVVEEKISRTKTGKLRKGSRTNILAWIRPQAKMRKRVDIYANYEQNESQHAQIISRAVSKVLELWVKSQKG